MRIELRDERRRRIGWIEADPALRPTRVMVTDRAGSGSAASSPSNGQREVFLNWDTAVDDAGHLRRCVVCGCGDLFREKVFPQITGLVVLMAFAGAVISLMGLVTPMLLALMVFVLVLDVAILLVSRQRLVCYRCRSAFSTIDIARYHRRWDRAIADRHPATPADGSSPRPDQPTAESTTTAASGPATRQGYLT